MQCPDLSWASNAASFLVFIFFSSLIDKCSYALDTIGCFGGGSFISLLIIALAVLNESGDIAFAVVIVYRPPDSPDSDFSKCMDKLQEMINDHSKDDRHSDVYVIGDFNMPVFNWEESAVSTNPTNGAYQRLMTDDIS